MTFVWVRYVAHGWLVDDVITEIPLADSPRGCVGVCLGIPYTEILRPVTLARRNSCKVPVIVVYFNKKLNVSTNLNETPPNPNLLKMYSLVLDSTWEHTDGQTDRHGVANRNIFLNFRCQHAYIFVSFMTNHLETEVKPSSKTLCKTYQTFTSGSGQCSS
jgi:acyl-CoA-binding protein